MYILALLGACFFGLGIVWNYAEEYEFSRPENTIDAYTAELEQNNWMDSMRDVVKAMPHEMQTDAECIDFVKDMLSGDITYSRTATETGYDGISYALFCDGKKFGVVTIVEDKSYADKLKYGMMPWMVANETFDFTALYSNFEITVPSTFTVELNGNELGQEYIVAEGIKLAIDWYKENL